MQLPFLAGGLFYSRSKRLLERSHRLTNDKSQSIPNPMIFLHLSYGCPLSVCHPVMPDVACYPFRWFLLARYRFRYRTV